MACSDSKISLQRLTCSPHLADSYHWKGMDKEAIEMRVRELRQPKAILSWPPLSAAHSNPVDTPLLFIRIAQP